MSLPKLSQVGPIVLQHCNEDELSANSPTSSMQENGSTATELVQDKYFSTKHKLEIHFFLSISVDDSYSLKTSEVTNS